MSSLRAAADKLIQEEQSGSNSITATEVLQLCSAYDSCLWEILTAPLDELVAFARLLFSQPYIDLPAPLQVAIFRIVGLESADDIELLQLVKNGIFMYCTPDEERQAAGKIQSRLRTLTGRV